MTLINELNKLIKETNAECFKNKLNSCERNPKEMWKTINRLTSKTSKTTNITEINQSGKGITDDHTMANTLNEYFSEVGPQLAANLCQSLESPESYLVCCKSHFQIQNVTVWFAYLSASVNITFSTATFCDIHSHSIIVVHNIIQTGNLLK